ncbi:MAG: NlpC/P60 family protein [Verrucomicrobiales bacterium]|nr:NlpC/P60 family protein [Verrucomicrobiales bacterium]MDF2378386.1 NlpC/P60 family protein [Verrucomicrobiales bacterium]
MDFHSVSPRLFIALTIVTLPALSTMAGPKARSFRPIIPIKQNVKSGSDNTVSQTVKLTIPSPPIPEPAVSLFPDDTVPEINLPPESEKPLHNEEGEFSEMQETDLDSDTSIAKDTETSRKNGPTLQRLREEAHILADMGLKYKFGADDPDSGGLDCSGAMQYLLNKIGIDDVPRTSYDQYYWLKKKKKLDDVYGKGAAQKMFKKLSPGDLIFWGGTWKSGHRVSHVMLYMGYNPAEEKHYVFGARSKSSEGLLGHGVDIFELDPSRGRLIAHGKIPGLIY